MRCYSHLSDDEREQIGLAKALGHSIGAIAQAIGRPKSTISRELSRNKLTSGRYSPLHAAGAYQLRRRPRHWPTFGSAAAGIVVYEESHR
jgi:IS30 family transposase